MAVEKFPSHLLPATWHNKYFLNIKKSYKRCVIAYRLSKKSLDLIALQITNRPQGSQGSSEDCNGQSVEETEEDEHWRGEETDSSSDNNNTVSFLHFHHIV